MADAMGVPLDWPQEAEAALTRLAPGHAFTVPEVLFAKIADEQREEWAVRFAGIRA
jgi:methionyl-tRNA synthetase